MRPADATRRTIRMYVALGSLLAALGVGVALGADPYPDPPTAQRATAGQGDVQRTIASIAVGPVGPVGPVGTADPAGTGYDDAYDDTSGQS